MTPKRSKKAKPGPARQDLRAWIAEVAPELVGELDRRQAFRRRYDEVMQSIDGLQWKERATAWLRVMTERVGGSWEDVEALVYLRSQGEELPEAVAALRRDLYAAADHTVDTFGRGDRAISEDRERAIREGTVPPFWPSRVNTEVETASAVLRAAEWCEIGGLETWWEALRRGMLEGDASTEWSSREAFCFSRSSYALRFVGDAVKHRLTVVLFQREPWDVLATGGVTDPEIAAQVVFAVCRLPELSSDGVVDRACRYLLRSQEADGSWRGRSRKASVTATATALHALATAKPYGFEGATQRGHDWLLAQQNVNGYWSEPGHGPVFLTVLALDAIELGSGGEKVTFVNRRAKNAVDRNGVGEPPAVSAEHAKGKPDGKDAPARLKQGSGQKSNAPWSEEQWNIYDGLGVAYLLSNPGAGRDQIARALGIRRQALYAKKPDGSRRLSKLWVLLAMTERDGAERRANIGRGHVVRAEAAGKARDVESYVINCYLCGASTEQIYQLPTGRELCDSCQRAG